MCVCVRYLLSFATSQNGNTALHEAVQHRQKTTVQLLMKSDCRLNLRNEQGESPMDVARKNDFREIMNLLSGLEVRWGFRTVLCTHVRTYIAVSSTKVFFKYLHT